MSVISIIAIMIGLCFVAVLVVHGVGYLGRKLQARQLARSVSGKLYLTYDDGPGVSMTSALLDLLSSRGAVATFFVKGTAAASRPEMVERIVRDGHGLGSHSLRHVDGWKRPIAGLIDVVRGHRLVARNHQVTHLRPPYGRPTVFTYLFCWLRRVRVIMWTVDAKDASSDIKKIADVVAEVDRAGGAVVLMHDLDLELPEAGDRQTHVLSLTSALLDLAARKKLVVSRF